MGSGIETKLGSGRNVEPGGATIGIVRIEVIRSGTDKALGLSTRYVICSSISCPTVKLDAVGSTNELTILDHASPAESVIDGYYPNGVFEDAVLQSVTSR